MDTIHKKPTQQDVARHCGVSTATVSRVLNQPHTVTTSARQQVLTAIDTLGYVADAAARTLVSKRSKVIGAVIPTLSNAIFADGIEAFESALKVHDYSLMLTFSNYEPSQELRHIRTLIAQGVDGILLVGQARDTLVYELMHKHHIPFVETWTYRNDTLYPCVGFDNFRAGQIAPEYLLSLGHREFGVITGIADHNDRVNARLAGLYAYLARHYVHLPPQNIIQCRYDLATGRQACRQLLALRPRPTALICHNDVLATGALLECQSRGVKVPQDMSIIGFDDLPISANLNPSLTTLHIPFKVMGSQAADFLLGTIHGHNPVANVALEVTLVMRQSTGPILTKK